MPYNFILCQCSEYLLAQCTRWASGWIGNRWVGTWVSSGAPFPALSSFTLRLWVGNLSAGSTWELAMASGHFVRFRASLPPFYDPRFPPWLPSPSPLFPFLSLFRSILDAEFANWKFPSFSLCCGHVVLASASAWSPGLLLAPGSSICPIWPILLLPIPLRLLLHHGSFQRPRHHYYEHRYARWPYIPICCCCRRSYFSIASGTRLCCCSSWCSYMTVKSLCFPAYPSLWPGVKGMLDQSKV